MLQQVIGDLTKLRNMGFENILTLLVAAAEDLLNFAVDPGGRFLRIALGLPVVPANEYLTVGIEGHRAQIGAHAVFGDHLTGNGGSPLEVIGGAGGDVAEHQRLCHTSAQQGDDLLQHFVAAHVAVILRGQGDGHAACHTPGDDGDLMNRVMAGKDMHHNGVSRLVDRP